MTGPPRDNNGRVEPHDDPLILDDELLLRRIPGSQVVTDNGVRRISSGLFSPSSIPNHGVSFIRMSKWIADERDVIAETPEEFGIATISVGFLRQIGLIVGESPDEEVLHHVEAWRKGERRLTKSQMNRMRDEAIIIRMPPV